MNVKIGTEATPFPEYINGIFIAVRSYSNTIKPTQLRISRKKNVYFNGKSEEPFRN